MENVSYIALSRQTALQRQLDIVAHNLANLNTPAFKGEQMLFAEYITEPARGEQISFVQDIGLARNLTEGPMTSTGNPLDIAISGNAYFVVETPLGDRYTRHGRLQLDADRQITTSQGYPILSNSNQPIAIPEGRNDLSIAADGTISDETGPLGRIGLVQFADEQLLRRNANALYNTNQQPEDATDSKIKQGMLEESNVQPILELTRLIELQRQYQQNQRFITSEHDRIMKAIDKLTNT